MSNISTLGPSLVAYLAKELSSGKSPAQVMAENEARIREFTLSFSSVGHYSLEMAKILAAINKEVDATHAKKVKEMLDACVDQEWSEESKVRITEEVIRTSNQQNLMSKATPAILSLSGLALIGVLAAMLHKKPKSRWKIRM